MTVKKAEQNSAAHEQLFAHLEKVSLDCTLKWSPMQAYLESC